MPDIDFARIRAHRGDRKLGFEELVRQILIASSPPGCVRIEHKGAGADGGVEVLVHRSDGSSWGYQTKYFDGAFTYNKHVNRLATVQEHYMIVRALDRGVSEEKLARALNVDTKLIQRRRSLLDGICSEAVDLLKDRTVNPQTFEVLKRMRPMRQIEAAELMISVNNFTSSYATPTSPARKRGRRSEA